MKYKVTSRQPAAHLCLRFDLGAVMAVSLPAVAEESDGKAMSD